jgi:uncharacterized membrane protein
VSLVYEAPARATAASSRGTISARAARRYQRSIAATALDPVASAASQAAAPDAGATGPLPAAVTASAGTNSESQRRCTLVRPGSGTSRSSVPRYGTVPGVRASSAAARASAQIGRAHV